MNTTALRSERGTFQGLWRRVGLGSKSSAVALRPDSARAAEPEIPVDGDSDNLSEIDERVGSLFTVRSRRYAVASFWTKLLLVGAAAASTALHFAAGHWNVWTYVGVAASLLVLLCSWFLIQVDLDASQELDQARRAIGVARAEKQKYSGLSVSIELIQRDQRRASELFRASMQMQTTVYQSLNSCADIHSVLTNLLQLSKRSLRYACDLREDHHYTICIYESRPSPADKPYRSVLHLIAHDRSIDCPIEQGRKWPYGEGAAGYCLATNEEVNIADLTDAPFGMKDASDASQPDGRLYRSLVAVPVRVQTETDAAPWGVVVGTSNKPGHFTPTSQPGVHTAEGIRALAAMVALAVRSHNVRQHSRAESRAREELAKNGQPLVNGPDQPLPPNQPVQGSDGGGGQPINVQPVP